MQNKEIGVGNSDFYISHPPSKPKLEFGNLNERTGLVPRRHDNLQCSLDSKKPFLIRDELPYAPYESISGLMTSYRISKQIINKAKDDVKFLKERGLNLNRTQIVSQIEDTPQEELEYKLKLLSIKEIETYCKLLKLDPEQFFSEISYSYWELLGGYNRTIIADSAIRNRYHILTTSSEDDKAGYGYKIIENGKIITNSSRLLPPELDSTDGSLIDSYETSRNNGRFINKNCYLEEFQTCDHKQFFLQILKGTDFNPAKFELKQKPKKDEIEATFVRGATYPGGCYLTLNIYPPLEKENGPIIPEDGALDMCPSKIYVELMLRQRRVEVFVANNVDDIAESISKKDHLSASRLFKPEISIGITEEDMKRLSKNPSGYRPDGVAQIEVKVISDGRRGLIEPRK